MTIDVPVFDPICTSKESVETILKNFSRDDNVRYIHPYGNREQCTYENKKIKWETLKTPVALSSLLNVNSNLAATEDGVLKLIREHFSQELNISFKENDVTIQPIPEGQETLECFVDLSPSSPPPIFVVSKIVKDKKRKNDDNYFDLVFHRISSQEKDLSESPLYFHAIDLDYAFVHSGDKRFHGRNLTQYLRVNPKNNSNCSGIITAHAYEQKSFLHISACNPNICLVDYRKESKSIIIYVIHFPLTKDFVGNSSIGHICKFDYLASEGKIIWTIPPLPEFDDQQIDVGECYGKYKKGIDRFMSRLEVKTSQERKKKEEDVPKMSRKMIKGSVDENKNSLIIQKPLVKNEKCKKIIKEFSSRLNCDKTIFTFHRNIGTIDDDDHDEEDNNFGYTLPIAGGSIVSEKSSVKLGKPIKKESTAIEFQKSLTLKKVRPVVILSNKTSSADIPKVHAKLNAIYILFDSDETTRDITIEERLNNLNACLPVAMQGSLSTVFAYCNDFYYYRGIIRNSDNLKFGDRVEISDIINEASGSLIPPLVTSAFSPRWMIYDKYGRELFDISSDDDDDLTVINNIIYNLIDDDTIKSQMKFIIAQMEVNLNSKKFEEIIMAVLKMIHQSLFVSKEKCLQLIIDNEKQIYNCPPKSEIRKILSKIDDGYFNKNWLISTVARIVKCEDRITLLRENHRTILDMFKVVKTYTAKLDAYAKSLLEILNNSVSMRSSYGIRKKGLNQIIRSRDIKQNLELVENMNEDAMENFFSDNCTNDGVIILAINEKNFVQTINEKNDFDKFLKSLTQRFLRFDSSPKEMAAFYLPSPKQFNFLYDIENSYSQKSFLIFPLLEDLKLAMKEPHKFAWREIKKDGAIDLSRIMLRRSIYELIPSDVRDTYNIIDPGAPIIGKILINVLFSAIHAMAGSRTNFSSSNEDDGWITKLRCLTGLILSIMASGSNCPFSLVYQTVLRENKVTTTKINLSNSDENFWLHELLKIWPYLRIPRDVVDVESNAVNCISNRITDAFQAIDVIGEEKQRENTTGKKARWYCYTLRHMVNYILSFEHAKIIQEAEQSVKTEHPLPRFAAGAEEARSDGILMEKIDILSRDEEKKIQKEVDIVLNMTKCNDREKYWGIFYPSVVKENIHLILNEYEQLSNKNEYKHFLFTYLERLDERVKMGGKNIDNLLNVVYSTALEIYLKHSFFLYEPVRKLRNYICETRWKNSKTMKEVLDLNDLKNDILKKALPFKTSLFKYVYVPEALIELMKCKTWEDYQSQQLLDELNKYLAKKSKVGHFRSAYVVGEEDSLVDDVERKRREKIEKALENNINLRQMMKFLSNYVQKENIIEKVMLSIMNKNA